jgi:hypothetical protein
MVGAAYLAGDFWRTWSAVRWWYGYKYIATASFAVQGQTAYSGLLSSSLSLANALGLQGSTPKGGGGYDNRFFSSLIQSRRVIKESLNAGSGN